MELNVTKENLTFCRALLKTAVVFSKALNAEIDLVKKQGATTPDGVKTKGGKKAAKKVVEAPKEEKPSKVTKKAAKKAAKKATAKKDVAPKETTESGSRVTLKMRVKAYLSDKKTSDDLWSPKELLNSEELDGTGNVPLNQVLNQLIEAGEITRVSRGQYKLV